MQVHPEFTHHLYLGFCPGEDWGCPGWHALQRRTSQSQGLALGHSEVFHLQSPMCRVNCVSRPPFLPWGGQNLRTPSIFVLSVLFDLVKPLEWTILWNSQQDWMILVGMLLPGRNNRNTLIILLAALITMFEATSHSGITKTHNDTTSTTQQFNELGLFHLFQCCFTCLSWVSRSIVESTHWFERLPGMCFDRLEVKRWPAVHEWPQTTTVP